jgi:Putative Flp pilus-assembly TadE/G-like
MNPSQRDSRRGARGQVLAIMGVGIVVMLLGSALIIDGGNAWAQQRGTQNASDSASLAGSSVLLYNMAGASKTNADVLAAVNAAFVSNGTTFGTAHYIDFNKNDLGPIPNNGAAIPVGGSAPAGVMAQGTRAFRTYFAGLAGFNQFHSQAEATSLAGTAEGVCAASQGCGVLPVTFSINTENCDGQSNIVIGKDLWPTVDLQTAKADQGTGRYEAIYPLCKVGPGGVGWLDFGCGGNLGNQITSPCNKPFDIPTWIQTSPGDPNSVESEMNSWAGKVILIPLFDSTCRDIPASGLTQDCTDPGNGNNLYYHIPKFVAMLLDHAYIQGNNRPACNSAPGTPIGGNGGTSCLKGWFTEYVIQGPVGQFDPSSDNASVLAIQLIK